MRLVWATLAIAAAATWAVYAVACDKKSQASAANASSEMAKTCAAHQATAASASGCPMHGASATTASNDGGCPMHGAAAVTAANAGACPHSASATTASNDGGCAMHGAATAVTASTKSKMSAADGCCSGKEKSAHTAGMSCSHDGAAMAGVSGCSGQGMMAGTCPEMHGACDACEEATAFDQELGNSGADVQAVPIKNGIMFVYTASSPGQVSAIQSVMARRSDHLKQLVNAGDKSKLCPECKTMRGAMASGKVTREVVNIEGGSLTLLTSNDPAMVKRIRSMADHTKLAARTTKS